MLAPWRAYRQLRSASVALQCRMRQKIAYSELRDLRMKAKDVGNLKGDNERLKAEILQLRQAAASAAASAGDERVSCGETLIAGIISCGEMGGKGRGCRGTDHKARLHRSTVCQSGANCCCCVNLIFYRVLYTERISRREEKR